MPDNKKFERPDFTLEDFHSGRPIEWLESIKSGYQRTREEYALRALAKELKFTGFPQMLKAYREEIRRMQMSVIREDGISEFADQALDLNIGEWTADESGVWRCSANGKPVYACPHPIMPVLLMRSIDTGLMKVKLAYRRSYADRRPWSEIVVPMSRISKANDIVGLADCGVSVTSGERAQALVDFLRDVLDRNTEIIPEVKSVSRMGWNEDGFSPYVGGVLFDSADVFQSIYKDLRQSGSLAGWLAEALEARTYSLPARIVLAASFASALVEPMGCLCFFIHLWSIGSGTGKSVALMLGASVWGNPKIGDGYFQTFKGTSVSFELRAGFLHSLPMFLDEYQLARDRRGKTRFSVYELSAGSGKSRANKALGLDYTPRWDNCIITSGETPLVMEEDGAGAYNRVIEIDCTGKGKIIRDGRKTADALKQNFGHAGRLFIEKLCEEGRMERVKRQYEENYAVCVQSDATEKQAMAAALILTADQLATEWIFRDGRALTADELGGFLKEESEVSMSERGYQYMCDWVAANASQFRDAVERGEHYGVIHSEDDGTNVAVINRSIWNRTCEEAGISSKALLGSLKADGLLRLGAKGYTRTKKIDGIPVACVWMVLPRDEEPLGPQDDLPL